MQTHKPRYSFSSPRFEMDMRIFFIKESASIFISYEIVSCNSVRGKTASFFFQKAHVNEFIILRGDAWPLNLSTHVKLNGLLINAHSHKQCLWGGRWWVHEAQPSDQLNISIAFKIGLWEMWMNICVTAIYTETQFGVKTFGTKACKLLCIAASYKKQTNTEMQE